MVNKAFYIVKKIIISILILYGFNIFTQPYNINIPINIITILFITIFDMTGFLGIILFYFINYR